VACWKTRPAVLQDNHHILHPSTHNSPTTTPLIYLQPPLTERHCPSLLFTALTDLLPVCLSPMITYPSPHFQYY
jgi:hypothetical protein